MLLQPELAFEGLDDALDPLTAAAQRAIPGRLVSTVGPDDLGAQLADAAFEVAAGEPLVGGEDGTGKPAGSWIARQRIAQATSPAAARSRRL